MLQFMIFCIILVRVKGIKRFKADGCFKDGDYVKKNKIFMIIVATITALFVTYAKDLA